MRSFLLPFLAFGFCSSLVAESVPEISSSGLALFQERFDELEKSYETLAKSYATRIAQNKNPEYGEKLAASDHHLHLAFHRELFILETDLVLIATPEDNPDAQDTDPSDLSSTERRRVASLRQDIRDAERKRITEALKEGSALHADERNAQAIYRDESSLDELFDRATARQQRDIDTARRALDRELKASFTNDARIDQLRADIERAETAIAEIHHYVYGFKPGEGLDVAPEWPAEHPAEKLRLAIRAARDAVRKRIVEGADKGGEDGARGGIVGGSYIYSTNFGIVLDVSGSMGPHIEPLKTEIANTFDGPRYREVSNCVLNSRGITANGDLQKGLLVRDNAALMEELITIARVDTLYWFSDLQDDRDIQSLRHLGSLLRRGSVAFHVKSMDKKPDRELEPIVDDFQQ